MNKKSMDTRKDTQREQMIQFIIRVIQELDDEGLHNLYHFLLHIR